ncbi:MAG: glycosyltransferase [Chitinophagaceae bacterium]|nr:glycosyltransferase [Chitinophagaceae bacterium]
MFDQVSVIVPVYNAEEYLEKAVHSILQFEEVVEVLLIEDGSPDHSLQIAQELQSRYPVRVKLLQHPGGINKGAGASRNLGLKEAKGNYIAFLDADDFYLPTRFDHERIIYKQHPDAEGVYGAIGVHFYSDKARDTFCKQMDIPISESENYLTTIQEKLQPEEVFDALWGVVRKNTGYFSLDAFTIQTSAIRKHQLQFDETLRLHQDTEFLCRCAYFCKLYAGSIHDAVSMRGVHEENRMITIRKVRQTAYHRFLFYEVVEQWAQKNKLPAIYLNHFKIQKWVHALSKESFWKRVTSYLRIRVIEKDFFKRRLFKPVHQKLFEHAFLRKVYMKWVMSFLKKD